MKFLQIFDIKHKKMVSLSLQHIIAIVDVLPEELSDVDENLRSRIRIMDGSDIFCSQTRLEIVNTINVLNMYIGNGMDCKRYSEISSI